jgi:hypothetical protein
LSTLFAQYTDHPSWTYQLHANNLRELCRTDAALGTAPSYATVRRHMKGQGWLPRSKRGDDDCPAAQAALGTRRTRVARLGGCYHNRRSSEQHGRSNR